MTVIVDYGMGNLMSVYRKVKQIDSNVVVSSSPNDLKSADKIIIPGVGNFGSGVKKLKEFHLWDEIIYQVEDREKPILGICLGMQLMAQSSEEGEVDGFGWVNGKVRKFVSDNIRWKVPHMGWNTLSQIEENPLLKGIDKNSEFYFVHSFYLPSVEGSHTIGKTDYIVEFDSVIAKDNIFGTQFHPEKSHADGYKLLENFILDV